jgi:TPR repeat protein
MALNRFRWEAAAEARGPDGRPYQRVHAGLRFDKVKSVQFRNIDRDDRGRYLELLTIACDEGRVVRRSRRALADRLEAGARGGVAGARSARSFRYPQQGGMLHGRSRPVASAPGRAKMTANNNWLTGSKRMNRPIGLAVLLVIAAGALEASQARETPGAGTIEIQEQTPLERGISAYRRGDYAAALDLFTPLARAGDLKAQLYLASMYGEGFGTERDEATAAHWVGLAAGQGFARAQNSLGARHERGLGVAQDFAAAARWYRSAAEQGDARAQSNLGRMYKAGLGVPRDYREAANWYRKSAGQGFAPAQVILGYLYSTGRGVDRNHDEAARLYRQAALQGDRRGQWLLGVMFQSGRGVPRDAAAAAQWFRSAADQGLADAQNSLAELYRNGEGVTADQARAAHLFRLAAEQGHADAQMGLATMYHEGAGVAPNLGEAVRWYRRAAAQGVADAQYILSLVYVLGEGVERDLVTGYAWMTVAADNGHDAAPGRMPLLAAELTASQILDAQKLAVRLGGTAPRGR